jgi:hypothetical protein
MKTKIIQLSLAILSLITAVIAQHISNIQIYNSGDFSLNRFDYIAFMFTFISIVQLGFFIHETSIKDNNYGR